MVGITLQENIGIGDKVQFSSLPENYFRAKGEKLVDLSKSWIFDFNPYVLRNVDESKITRSVELWNFPQRRPWVAPRAYAGDPKVYLSNAEVAAAFLEVPVSLNRPRLYRYEYFPFSERKKILFHPIGKSHGILPDHVIEHVINKYGPTGELYQIGLSSDPDFGIPKIETPNFWALAKVVSEARMFIGADSGPSWVAACYPDVVVKKVRVRQVHGQKDMKDWIPLEQANIHAHWDDRIFSIHNVTVNDVGAFPSYRRL